MDHCLSSVPWRRLIAVLLRRDGGAQLVLQQQRGDTAKQRLHQVDSRITLVHTPVHASWLNQVEIDCSIIQRKVLTPNDVANFEAIRLRLALYEELSNQRPTPFQWKFDRTTLVTLLAKIEAHPKILSDAQSDCTEEAA